MPRKMRLKVKGKQIVKKISKVARYFKNNIRMLEDIGVKQDILKEENTSDGEVSEVETIEQVVNIFGNLTKTSKFLKTTTMFKWCTGAYSLKYREKKKMRSWRKERFSLNQAYRKGEPITEQTVRYVISLVDDDQDDQIPFWRRLCSNNCQESP